jgi:hypothetical protein
VPVVGYDVLIDVDETGRFVLTFLTPEAQRAAYDIFVAPNEPDAPMPDKMVLDNGVNIEDILEMFPKELIYGTKIPTKMIN